MIQIPAGGLCLRHGSSSARRDECGRWDVSASQRRTPGESSLCLVRRCCPGVEKQLGTSDLKATAPKLETLYLAGAYL